MLNSILKVPFYGLKNIFYNKDSIPQDMVLWLDPSDASTLTMDSGIPTNLGSLKDKSINSLSAENLTSGTSQPTLGLLNGRTAINFNGANSQFLNLGQPPALSFDLATASHTVFVVARSGDTSGVIIGRGNGDGTRRQQLSHNTTTGIHSSWGGNVSTGVTYTRNTTNILCWKTSPNTHSILQNGVEIISASSGTNTLTTVDLLIGARRSSGNTGIFFPYTGVIGEIIWYKRALSNSEIQTVNNYLSKKWRNTGKLLIVGASLENGMYPGLQNLINTTYNVDWTTVDLAIGGDTSTAIKNRIDADLASHAETGAYALLHVGGNDVTNTRPYSTATPTELSTLTDNLEYIYNAIKDAGVQVLPCNLSFRTYDAITNYYPEEGSKPYNDNIVQPTCAIQAPAFCYNDGTPYLDLYRFIQENVDLMGDEVHLTAEGYAAYRQFVVDTVMKKIIAGVLPTQYDPLPIPATPVLTPLVASSTSITATWTMSSETDVVGYAVEHKLTSDSTWTRSGIVTAPTKTLTITGLTEGASYDVRVKSASAVVPSDFSSIRTSALIFNDTFTDTDNTLLYHATNPKHTSDSGHTWLPQTGYAPTNQARILNNCLVPQSSQNVYRAELMMPNPNYSVKATIQVLSNTGIIGLTARASDSELTLYGLRHQSNVLTLFKRVAGTETILQTFAQTLTAGQTLTMELVCDGSSIQGYIDNALRVSANDTAITVAGSPGVWCPAGVTASTGFHYVSMTATLI